MEEVHKRLVAFDSHHLDKVFAKPVKDSEAPNYSELIKNPMSLQVIG